jgi:hypothetical protein
MFKNWLTVFGYKYLVEEIVEEDKTGVSPPLPPPRTVSSSIDISTGKRIKKKEEVSLRSECTYISVSKIHFSKSSSPVKRVRRYTNNSTHIYESFHSSPKFSDGSSNFSIAI